MVNRRTFDDLRVGRVTSPTCTYVISLRLNCGESLLERDGKSSIGEKAREKLIIRNAPEIKKKPINDNEEN